LHGVFKLIDYVIEIGITRPESPSDQVSAARGYSLAVRDHLELTSLARCRHGINVEALLDEGHETRGLGLVVVSRRAIHDFDLHDHAAFLFACSIGNEGAAARTIAARAASLVSSPYKINIKDMR